MFRFDPTEKQAQAHDTAMHVALADSLVNLAQQVQSVLPSMTADAVSAWRDRVLREGPVSPAIFGAYYDLVQALRDDDFVTAQSLWEEILSAQSVPGGPQINILGSDYCEQTTDRFKRYMGNGKTGVSGIARPHPKDSNRFAARLREALAIIDEHRPELVAELRHLIRDIVLVAPDDRSGIEFEGGTSFKLWGGLFLNAECDPSAIQLAVTLAHEEGHAVLFGMCRDEMLVENLDDERFWSPIRQSMRPMEGIFHATFVSARMIDLLIHLRQVEGLSVADKQHVQTDLDQAMHIYREGVILIREHARLTETGRQVFEAMDTAMTSHLAGV